VHHVGGKNVWQTNYCLFLGSHCHPMLMGPMLEIKWTKNVSAG